MNIIIFPYIKDERVVRLNRKLTAGVITSLLLAPTAIANAQENDAQTRVTPQTEQVGYANVVATATTREQLIAEFGKLSEISSGDEMVIAEGNLIVVQNSGDFNADEKAIIKAKYEYVVKHRELLTKLKGMGNKVNGILYSSKTFFEEVEAVNDEYVKFLGEKEPTDTTSYLYVQAQFKQAVDTALINNASSIAPTMRNSVLQYGYDKAARDAYFGKKDWTLENYQN